MRFGALQRKIEGVSQKMLSQALRNLEADGLVLRKAFDEMPLRVEYQLAEKGTSLLPLIHAIKRWAEKNLAYVTKAREAHGISQRASLGS
ncbi:transcriptional regulator [Roseibium hamelinense]|uniref:winged helix-turn-helix transcriptional regulator n=1 Tax=Roseibium hamelinense TaxID=150831 RepID=UPI00119EC2FD|nr:helix-turn-helix domain-containing protein [Roseibium hamelinense]MTI43224.1 transcriptional regulator [Roseibium hamelinense]